MIKGYNENLFIKRESKLPAPPVNKIKFINGVIKKINQSIPLEPEYTKQLLKDKNLLLTIMEYKYINNAFDWAKECEYYYAEMELKSWKKK